MNITTSSIRCTLQVALLGATTPNLRAVTVNVEENDIRVYFYYENNPSHEEEDLSEIIGTEIYADYINVAVEIHRIILPLSNKIPEIGLKVFHRSE